MADFANLVLGVDTSGLKRGERDLRSFGTQGARTERQIDSVGASARRMAVGVGIAAAAAASLRAAFRSAESYTSMTNGLLGMGQSAEQAAASLDAVAEIAMRTRAPLEATASLYRRISIASSELGASQQDVLRFTENVGLALAASGTSANEASGALLQLSQAMAGGVVRAEEFNSMLEGAYPIVQAAARGIDAAGGSVGRLRQLVLEGKISSDEFFTAILSQTDQLQAAFANTIPTISQATTVLGGQFTMLIGKMNGVLGASDAVAQTILMLAENLDLLVGVVAVGVTAFGVRYVGAMVAARLATFSLTGALAGLKAALISTGIGALIVGAGIAVGYFSRLVTAAGGFGIALGLLKDVAIEVWERIGIAMKGTATNTASAWAGIKASIANALANALDSVTDFANKVIGSFVGSFDAVVAVWGELPTAFKRIGALAINGLIDAMSAGLAGIVGVLNDVLGVVGIEIPPPDLSGWQVAVGDAADIGGAASAAFGAAFNADYIDTSGASDALRDVATEAGNASVLLGQVGDAIIKVATEPLESIGAIRDVMSEATTEIDDGSDAAADLADALDGVTGSAEGGAGAVNDMADAAGKAADVFKNQLTSAVDGVANAFGDWVASGFQDFKGMVDSILSSFKSMLSQMIATAIANPIKIALGIGGGAGATGAAGGLGGGIQSMISTAIGGFGEGGSILGLGGLGGGSGLLGGLGNAVSGGLGNIFSIGANAAAAQGGIMATLGAALPVIGIAAAVFSFFQTKTKLIDNGIRATIDMEDAMFESFKEIEKSRFWGLSKKRSTSFSALTGDDSAPLDAAVFGIRESVIGATESLGVSIDVFEGFTHDFTLSLKGLDEAARASAITEEFARMGDSMAGLVPHIANMNQLFAVAANRVNLTDRLLQAQGETEELTARIRGREMNATNELNKALLAQVFAAEDAKAAMDALTASFSENAYATGVDFRRGLSRASNGIEYTPQQSQAEMLIELKALNARMDVLQSTTEIAANSSAQTAENTDYSNALTLDAQV